MVDIFKRSNIYSVFICIYWFCAGGHGVDRGKRERERGTEKETVKTGRERYIKREKEREKCALTESVERGVATGSFVDDAVVALYCTGGLSVELGAVQVDRRTLGVSVVAAVVKVRLVPCCGSPCETPLGYRACTSIALVLIAVQP